MNFELKPEQKALVGTQGHQDYMMVGNTLLEEWQFLDWAENGYLGKSIVKRGYKPTHREVWVWGIQRSRFSPFEECLVKTNSKIIELGGYHERT